MKTAQSIGEDSADCGITFTPCLRVPAVLMPTPSCSMKIAKFCHLVGLLIRSVHLRLLKLLHCSGRALQHKRDSFDVGRLNEAMRMH